MKKSKAKRTNFRLHFKNFWREYQWIVMLYGVLAVSILGTLGFMEHFSKIQKEVSVLDIVYGIFQLFLLGLDTAVKNLNGKLEAARWLAPTIAAYTAIKGFAVIFGRQLQLYRAQSWQS